jgi:hypothetical protein
MTENFLGQTKLIGSGVQNRFIVCFILGKERGDIWHAREIVRLNIMMAIPDWRGRIGY